jgi:hypothetical protein
MISLPVCMPWEVTIKNNGNVNTLSILAPTREKARIIAEELYPHSHYDIQLQPDWDDAS